MVHIDHSVYPDQEHPPDRFATIEQQADYVHRVCGAWDFLIHPEPEVFDLFAGWKEVFDRFPVPSSPAYHAFRAWFGWEAVPTPEYLLPTKPYYRVLDEREGRTDPCEHMI
jgi:hypothetical protein